MSEYTMEDLDRERTEWSRVIRGMRRRLTGSETKIEKIREALKEVLDMLDGDAFVFAAGKVRINRKRYAKRYREYCDYIIKILDETGEKQNQKNGGSDV